MKSFKNSTIFLKRWRYIWTFLLAVFLFFFPLACHAAQLEGVWTYQQGSMVPSTGHGHVPPPAGEWKEFHFPAPPPAPIDGSPTFISTKLLQDASLGRESTLLFQTKHTAFSLWLGDRMIYSYGDVHSRQPAHGSCWHLVKLPPFDGEARLTFEVSRPPAFVPQFSYLTVDTSLSQTERGFIYDLPVVMALPISVLLVVVMSVYYFSKTSWTRLYRAVIMFLLVFICWLLSKSVLRQIYLFNNAATQYFSYILVYLLPISGNLIIREVVERRWKKIVSCISIVWFSVLAGTLMMESCGLQGIEFGSTIFLPILILVDSVNLYCLWLSGKSGNPYSSSLLFALASFVVLAIMDAVNAVFHLMPFYTCFEPFAIFSSLYFVLRLLHGQLLKEQNLELKTIRLKKEAEIATKRSETDALTKCWNRQKFDDMLPKMISSVGALGKNTLAFVMFDIDHFKKFNDTYGHKMGDQVLSRFADTVRSNLKEGEHFFRWGGEEFVLLFHCHDVIRAARFADRIRMSVERGTLCEECRVTVSIGISFWHGTSDSPESLFKRADDALYRAKGSGRNCLRMEEEAAK